MHVNPADGGCRGCGGMSEIIGADDAAMTAVCTESCGGFVASVAPTV